jgi:hypothetical protein
MDTPHDPFEEPSCAFEHALVLAVHRDVARARKAVADGPPLFSLADWTAHERKAFWILLYALGTQIDADRYCETFVPRAWPGAWEGLRQIDALCDQGAVPFRFFIVEAEKTTRGVRVSTGDSIRAFCPDSGEEQPASKRRASEGVE